MKKICSECGAVNDYEREVCFKCGVGLNEGTKYKMCPYCGKKYNDLNKKTCDEDKYDLIVRGRPAAAVFDEKSKSEISFILRILCIILPVVGIIIAAVYTVMRSEGDNALQPETAKTFIITTVTVQIVLVGIIVLFAMLLSGSSFDLMKDITGISQARG